MPRLSVKLVRYAVVGVLTLAVYLTAGHLTRWLAASVLWQASLSFAIAVAVNYVLQRIWVFEDSTPISSSLSRYVAMVVIGFLINLLALTALSPVMPLLAAQLAAVVLVVASNGLLSFAWVFVQRHDNVTAGSC